MKTKILKFRFKPKSCISYLPVQEIEFTSGDVVADDYHTFYKSEGDLEQYKGKHWLTRKEVWQKVRW